MIKIGHIADLQVKNRDKNLYLPYFMNLKQIVELVRYREFDSLVIAGDLFEYPIPTESERKLIYNFVVDLVKLEHLKEIVIISGNHDLEKYKKKQQKADAFESDVTNNLPVLGVFTEMIKNINQEFDNKIIYMKESKIYDSKLDNVKYIAYSLEDGCNPDLSGINEDNINICVYHGMLKEYVDSVKLPVKNSVYESLDSLEIFPKNSLIMAGDIHLQLKYEGLNGQTFYYSGSTQQHTHNEGDFYNIMKVDGEVKVTFQHGEEKAMNEFIFKTGVPPTLNKIPLTNYVRYYTVEISEECNFEDVKEGFKKIFDLLTDKNMFGKKQNYMKIKSINKLIKNEYDIFDTLHNKYGANYNINFSFEYPKISTTSIVTNETVKEVIKSVTEEVEGDVDDITLSKDNIDKLILKNDDIVKLFEDVLNTQLDSVKIEDVDRDTIKNDTLAIFKQELKNRNAEKRYDIVFKNIKCTGFMGLGENDINLDIPGIVRILGTNGIGKTTLFKMIRWVISGELLEGMKSNTVVKNNLLVFNKDLPDVDDLSVTLDITINNVPVSVTRSLHRTWKNTATKEQKYAKNWEEYVTGVDRNIKITINPGTEKAKTLVGENAELNIKIWFGDTINNIMFLNQSKIESFMHSEPDKLNKIVLNYIGVDYIQKLEDNLDEVKEKLLSEVTKPKLGKEDIQISITDAEVFLKKSKEKLEELKQNDLDNVKYKIEELEKILEDYNKKLVDIGNVPELLDKNNKKLEQLTHDIDNFDFMELKQRILFDEKEPELSEEKKDLLNKIADKIKTIDELIQKKDEEILIEKDCITSNIDLLKKSCTKYEDNIKENIDNCNGDILVAEGDIKKEKENILKAIDDVINKRKEINHNLTKEKYDFMSEENKYNEKINENLKVIESGICPTCKRPLSDDYESHKQKILEENKYLENQVVDLNKKIVELNSKIDVENEEILIFTTFYGNIKDIKSSDDFDDMDKFLNYFNEYKDDLLGIKEYYKIIETKQSSINKLTHILNCVLSFEKLSNGINIENIEGIEQEYENVLNKTIKNVLEALKGNLIKEKELRDLLETDKSNKQKLEQKVKEVNDELTQKKSEYFERLKKVENDNKHIDLENEIVREHNKKKDLMSNEKTIVSKEIDNLNSKLPLFEQYNKERLENQNKLTEQKNYLATINEDITKYTLEVSNNENNLKKFQQMYDDYIKYQKNQIVWKIYNKLIKNGFRDIVFEYYRCFLNNTLNNLLEDVNFKLYWDSNNKLFMVNATNGVVSYQPVILSSGMETSFLGLSLIYTIHLLNVKNSISHIFIDELSGTLSKGDNLTYNAKNYQELFIKILNKFNEKTIFIVDHNIDNLFETLTYEVYRNFGDNSSKFRTL